VRGCVPRSLPGPGSLVLIAAALTAIWQTTAIAEGGAWLGPGSRVVLLNQEQRRSGLEGADLFLGFAGGVGLGSGRLSIDGEVARGGAVQRLRIDEVADPRLHVWTVSGGVRLRPRASWPLTARARVGVWHFDYRDESAVLVFPGLQPTLIAFDDFSEPMASVGGGLALAPRPWLGLDLELGLLGLRLNEARIDGGGATVTPSWRVSPTAAIGLSLHPSGLK
jgi:hypothetical protein